MVAGSFARVGLHASDPSRPSSLAGQHFIILDADGLARPLDLRFEGDALRPFRLWQGLFAAAAPAPLPRVRLCILR